MLEKFGLIQYYLAFVKYEVRNLGFMVMTLQSIVDCKPLKILYVYEGICFGHIMFKYYQYATNDDKVYVKLTLVSVKDSHVGL